MEENKEDTAHCLVVPFPLVGHLNPMLQFCKRLEQQRRGVKVTLATTPYMFKTMRESHSSIAVEIISDGFDERGYVDAESTGAYLETFQRVGSESLSKVVEKFDGKNDGHKVNCIVFDMFIPWVLDVAKKFGLPGAAFFTQSCAVDNIYYHVKRGLLKVPPPLEYPKVSVPGLPALGPPDLPSFITNPEVEPALFDMIINQFSIVDKVDFILCNTFDKLEQEAVDWMSKRMPLKTIGPAVPSAYLDKRIKGDKDYGLNLDNPNKDACIKWLNEQQDESVVYVSFGSLLALEVEQIEELAWGLRGCNRNFLWVVRTAEQGKLPKNFMEENSDRGLVVSWCPQLEVLAHKAVGCFVTHCGWNSTLEALSLGVPMLAMPSWTDQPTNAKYVTDVWKVGFKAAADEKGIVRREVLESCIREILDGDQSKAIRENSIRWRELAIEAVDEGGSSDKNIDELLSKLIHISSTS